MAGLRPGHPRGGIAQSLVDSAPTAGKPVALRCESGASGAAWVAGTSPAMTRKRSRRSRDSWGQLSDLSVAAPNWAAKNVQ